MSHQKSLQRNVQKPRVNWNSPVNNTQTEHFRANSINPHKSHGYSRSQNAEYDNTNNAGSRSNEHLYHSNNRLQRDNILPEQENNDSNLKKRTVNFSLPKNNKVELNTCENAWTPSFRNSRKSTETKELEIEEIQKKVRSILNKITPDTMIVLTKSIIDMQINTYNGLSKIVDLLFQKAIDEPNFTPQYAYICFQMKDIEVKCEDNETKISFRQIIIRKCQKTFELVNTQEKNTEDSLTEIESCQNEALKEELKFKYEENETIHRKRSVGNCRFICEMFKAKLLNSTVLEKCIRHLLKFTKDEPLECLCNILKQIGKDLNLENIFEKLQEYSSTSYKTKISSRIRFMILDLIDLKNNNWIPRNAAIIPKKLSEVEEEFRKESAKNLTISKCNLPIERQSKIYSNSNTQKVIKTAPIHKIQSVSYSKILQNKKEDQKSANSNIKKDTALQYSLAENSYVDEELTMVSNKNSTISKITLPIERQSKMISNSNIQKVNTVTPIPQTKSVSYSQILQNKKVDQKTINKSIKRDTVMEYPPLTKNTNGDIPKPIEKQLKLTSNSNTQKEVEKKVQKNLKTNTSMKAKTDIEQVVEPRVREKKCPAAQREVAPQRRSAAESKAGCSRSTDGFVVESVVSSAPTNDSSAPHARTSTRAIGVAGAGGVMAAVVEKGAPLPVTRSVEFVVEDMDRPIAIYTGDGLYVADNTVVGELQLQRPSRYDADRRSEVHAIVTVRVDVDGETTAGCECRAIEPAKKMPRKSGSCRGRVDYAPSETDNHCVCYPIPAVRSVETVTTTTTMTTVGCEHGRSLAAVEVQPPADPCTPRHGDPVSDDTRLPIGFVVPADGSSVDGDATSPEDSTMVTVGPVDDSLAHESLYRPVEDRQSTRLSVDKHEGGTDAWSVSTNVVTCSVDSASTDDLPPNAHTSSRAIGVAGVGGRMVDVVEKGASLPVVRSVEFLVKNLNRPITIYSGDCLFAAENTVVGELQLPLPSQYDSGRRTCAHAIVTVQVDAEGKTTAGCECRAVGPAKKRPRKSGTCRGRVDYAPSTTEYNCGCYSVLDERPNEIVTTVVSGSCPLSSVAVRFDEAKRPEDSIVPHRVGPVKGTHSPKDSAVPVYSVSIDCDVTSTQNSVMSIVSIFDDSLSHGLIHGQCEDRPDAEISVDKCNKDTHVWPYEASAAHDVVLDTEDVDRVTPTVHTAKADICDGDERAIVVESSVVEREAVEKDVVANSMKIWIHDTGGKIKHLAQSMISNPVAQTIVIGHVLIFGIGIVKSYI